MNTPARKASAAVVISAAFAALGATALSAPAQAARGVQHYETYAAYGDCYQASRAYAASGATIVRPCFPVRASNGYNTYYRFIYTF